MAVAGPRKLVYTALDEIAPAERNAKGHAENVIRGSISRFGYIEPIVMDERTQRIVGGHGRRNDLLARRDAGEAPPDGVVVRSGVWFAPVVRGWASENDAEAAAAAITLNRSGELGGWLADDLAPMLAEIARTDLGFDGVGFTDADLTDLLRTIELRDAPSDDETAALNLPPAVPADPMTRRGDVWQLGPHRLLCGDCREPADVAIALDGQTINVAVTSPPYAEQRTYDEGSGFVPIPPDEYVEWFAPVAANVEQHLADDGSWFVNIKPSAEDIDTFLYVFDLVLAHVRAWGWHFATEFCWERTGVPKHVTLRFKNQYEPIYQFARSRWKIRPDHVKHLSDNAIVPMGPGVGSTTWSGDQGNGPILPQHGQGGAAVGDSAAERGRANQLASAQERLKPPRKRKHPTGGIDGQGPEAGNDVGDYKGEGFAYPGNRLPSFSGTHEALGHSAAFPVGLPSFFALAYSDVGDVVFDPFAGSGSTIIAALRTQRVGVGVELSPGYCDVTAERFQRESGVLPILVRPDGTTTPIDLVARREQTAGPAAEPADPDRP